MTVESDTDAQSGVGKDPATARGERTRANLVAAARKVFEKRGYLDTKLSDITAAAKCSTGTFYTYFTDKADILRVVLEQVADDMLHPEVPAHDGDTSLRGHLEASNRAYLQSYRRNAGMMKLLDQIAAIDPDFREVRRRRSNAFIARNARAIEALQAKGLADPTLDAAMSATALSAMVSRMAFHIFCFDEDVDLNRMVDTCTDLWMNALRLPRTV